MHKGIIKELLALDPWFKAAEPKSGKAILGQRFGVDFLAV
jgi:hypothetical protein